MTKYIYATILVALIAAALWVNHLVKTVGEQAQIIEKKKQENSSLTKAKDDALIQAFKDHAWSMKYQSEQDKIRNESKIKRSDVNAGVRIVYVHATCPKLPNAEPDTAGTTTASPELTPDAREGYLDHSEAIDETDLLVRRLQARVIEDYEKCGAK